MGDQIDELDIRNTDPTPGGVQTLRDAKEGVIKIVNGLNQDVTITIQTTTFDDEGFDLPIVRSERIVLAGTRDYICVGESWVFVRPVATCAIAPFSGTLKMVWDFN